MARTLETSVFLAHFLQLVDRVSDCRLQRRAQDAGDLDRGFECSRHVLTSFCALSCRSGATDEARALAEQIQELSSELDENRGTLEAAQQAAEQLASGMDETASEADQLRSASRAESST